MQLDSQTLRFILAGLGVVLVVGIYLWDRYKRNSRGPRLKMGRKLPEVEFNIPDRDDDVGEVRVRRRAPEEPFPEEPFIDQSEPPSGPEPAPAPKRKREPKPAPQRLDPIEDPGEDISGHGDVESFSASQDPVPDSKDSESAAQAESFSTRDAQPETEPVELNSWDRMDSAEESQFTFDFDEFSAHPDTDYLNIDPALLDEVPRLIVQIGVMSRKAPFSISQIRKATAEVDLQYGDMNIYHRVTDSGKTLFSMASGVEPGTFPKGGGEPFATPGMLLFTQLPGARDGLAIYSDMLFTAERLSALLDADLQDETHSQLTKQAIEHTREAILEHRRQIQLLRSRH